MVKIFGREPAAWLALVAVVVKLLTAFGLGLSSDQQAVVNAVAAAAAGLVVAFLAHDALAAPLYGFAQAALALAAGFGLHWSADQQAIVLSTVQVVIAMFVRTQINAPVPAPQPKQPATETAPAPGV